MSNGQPLPAPSGYQRPTAQGRERSKSTFSLKSGNSHKSNGSANKILYSESHQEKESKRLHSKADPTMAMNEEQPYMAGSTGTNISNLRALQHRDSLGNPIVEPDLSNPTRSRWERPLDTIRAFEAAIDGNYKRQSYARTEADSIAPGGKRSSYYAGSNMGAQTPGRPPQDSYYGGRQSVYGQPDFRGNGNGMRQDGYPDQNGGPSNGYTPNRARYPRTSDQPMNNGQGPYPNAYGNQPSYETVTTASGSGSEPLGYSTDPSSENSSIDRYQAVGKGDLNGGAGEYGSYNNGNQQYNGNNGYGPPDGGYGNRGQGPPPAPIHRENVGTVPPRVPIKLGGSTPGGSQPTVYEAPRAEVAKRKSSFFKRFSKG